MKKTYGGFRHPYDDEDDFDDDPNAALAKLLGHHRNRRFNDYEYDSSDMEAGFDDIEREEKFSRKIGRLEDKRELERIRKEEFREKKKKLKS